MHEVSQICKILSVLNLARLKLELDLKRAPNHQIIFNGSTVYCRLNLKLEVVGSNLQHCKSGRICSLKPSQFQVWIFAFRLGLKHIRIWVHE